MLCLENNQWVWSHVFFICICIYYRLYFQQPQHCSTSSHLRTRPDVFYWGFHPHTQRLLPLPVRNIPTRTPHPTSFTFCLWNVNNLLHQGVPWGSALSHPSVSTNKHLLASGTSLPPARFLAQVSRSSDSQKCETAGKYVIFLCLNICISEEEPKGSTDLRARVGHPGDIILTILFEIAGIFSSFSFLCKISLRISFCKFSSFT